MLFKIPDMPSVLRRGQDNIWVTQNRIVVDSFRTDDVIVARLYNHVWGLLDVLSFENARAILVVLINAIIVFVFQNDGFSDIADR